MSSKGAPRFRVLDRAGCGAIPETFTPDDPAAFRRVLFRVAVQEVEGREAVPGGEE